MKGFKKILTVIGIIAAMLAPSVSAFAIGFDAETAYNSIFVIESGNSLGSGFALGENCVITNAHVISDKDNITIVTYNGEKINAEIYCINNELDIAVLNAHGAKPFVPLHACFDIADGDEVYAIGAPNSMAYTLTKGIVSSKDRKVNNRNYIQTDAAINTGNSGGPLMNNSGSVIGVNSYKFSNSEGIGLAIPIKSVVAFLNENKIETDDFGNVRGAVGAETKEEVPSTENPSAENPSEPQESNDDAFERKIDKKDLAIFIALIASSTVNIVMIIYIVFQKRKNIHVKADPSERTDFDIDILE